VLDDSALFRHADWRQCATHPTSRAPSAAREAGITFIKLMAISASLVNGAGLAMPLWMLARRCAGQLLDIGGGAARTSPAALQIILRPKCESCDVQHLRRDHAG
jgi:succinyl-CoA synthetase beta subunit